jgi:hypothetical protein
MARKKKTMMRKLEPAVLSINYNLTPGRNTLDLSRDASLLNRRFYRQGINWVVAGFRVFKGSQQGETPSGVFIAKLPNTWVLGNAWEKAFRHWQELNKRAIEAGESLPGRFTDFKIYMDDIHHGSRVGVPNNSPLPIDFSGNPAVPGEWVYSKIVLPDTTLTGNAREREIIAVGDNYPGAGTSGLSAVSLIEGYAASRALPAVADPNTPDDAISVSGIAPENWLGAINNEGNTQVDRVITDLTTENDQAPYPFENGEIPGSPGTFFTDTMYPGGANNLAGLQLVDTAYFNSGTNANKLYLKGDNFPCGLVRIVNGSDTNIGVVVDLVPGTHRGYLCEPMTEM